MRLVRPPDSGMTAAGEPSEWQRRYGDRHRLRRVDLDELGLTPTRRVRLYRRREHFILQWWDRGASRTLNERVEGDLLVAAERARVIDQRLDRARRTRHRGLIATARWSVVELIEGYEQDLAQRVEAGELTPATRQRYVQALHHLSRFIAQPEVAAEYRIADRVDRAFALRFSSFLTQPRTDGGRRLTAPELVLDVCRGLFAWAADPQRGDCLPAPFANPFLRHRLKRRRVALDMTAEPDITVAMAGDFLKACDAYAMRLFAPMVLCGLRASEPIFLFRENVTETWLGLPCIEALAYMTKGLRDKRLPLIPELRKVLGINPPGCGLIFTRRDVATRPDRYPLRGASLGRLTDEFQQRDRQGALSVPERLAMRDAVLRDAGAIDYGIIDREFRRVARMLGWPKNATLKDFRHLFSTCLANGGVPEHERKYLMGHAPGREAIVRYTHLNRLADHYRRAVEQEMPPVLDALDHHLTRDPSDGIGPPGDAAFIEP